MSARTKETKHPRSVPGFCERYGFGLTTFYDLAKRGQMPDVLKVGRRNIITVEAEAAWKLRHTQQKAA